MSPVVIAESSAGDTKDGYDNFKYRSLTSEYRRQQLKLIDLNDEAKFERVALLDSDLHIVPCRIAARLGDPEAFVISACMVKTHNTGIASLSIKNMVLGAPLHQATGENPRWSDKRKFHVGLRQTHYNMMVTAQRLDWGASLIDGYEGMEGNGPNSGTAVASRIALASTDFFAAARVGLETMGIPAYAVGYLQYAAQLGLGQYDLAKIDVLGSKPEAVKRTYRLHDQVDQQLKWLSELPKA